MAPPPEGARRCRGQGGCAGRASARRWPRSTSAVPVACASTASAIAGSTSSADRSGASSTNATPSAKRSCTATATANARRVFPTPPIPVNVTNRCSPTKRHRAFQVVLASQQRGRRHRQRSWRDSRVTGRVRRSAPGRHRRNQRSPRIGIGTERIAQSAHRVRVRAGASPTLERTDRVTAQPGTLGQLLLRQTGGFSQGSKTRCQRCTGHRDVPSASESRVGPPAPSEYG